MERGITEFSLADRREDQFLALLIVTRPFLPHVSLIVLLIVKTFFGHSSCQEPNHIHQGGGVINQSCALIHMTQHDTRVTSFEGAVCNVEVNST